jgi:hypothetical protein
VLTVAILAQDRCSIIITTSPTVSDTIAMTVRGESPAVTRAEVCGTGEAGAVEAISVDVHGWPVSAGIGDDAHGKDVSLEAKEKQNDVHSNATVTAATMSGDK